MKSEWTKFKNTKPLSFETEKSPYYYHLLQRKELCIIVKVFLRINTKHTIFHSLALYQNKEK